MEKAVEFLERLASNVAAMPLGSTDEFGNSRDLLLRSVEVYTEIYDTMTPIEFKLLADLRFIGRTCGVMQLVDKLASGESFFKKEVEKMIARRDRVHSRNT